MVVLMVGIPGVDAGTLPRTSGNLEFVAVESLAEALEFLDRQSCEALMIGGDAADLAAEPLLALRSTYLDHASRGGSAATEARDGAGEGPRDRDDAVEAVFRRGSIRDMERLMILDRLARLNQNRTRSAESLAISVRTLRNKLRDYRTQGTPLVATEIETG